MSTTPTTTTTPTRTNATAAAPVPAADVRAWLDAFAAAVRSADYAAGEPLFAPDVVGFGTVGVLLNGRAALVASQWRRVWGATSGFRFDYDRLACGGTGDTAWAAVPWSSTGHAADGTRYPRSGRATYVLARRAGRWVAVHSHHSLDPDGTSPAAGPGRGR
ncbi:MAG TPA: nuclear transport factor 2 family protein [Humisphaera sp.]